MKINTSYFSNLAPGKPPWRVLFFGTDKFAVHPLRKLVENLRLRDGSIIEQIDVVCPPDRRRVINKKVQDSGFITVREYATKEGIAIHEWRGKGGWKSGYRPGGPHDVGVVASFGYLIPNKVIDLCPSGMINIHPSMLPQWRGAAPMTHAILSGACETGVSIVEVSRNRFDHGNILLQETFKINDDIMYDDLSDELAIFGTKMMMYTLEHWDKLWRSAWHQPKEGGTYARKNSIETGYVDWDGHTWEHIWRKWRALSTRTGIHTSWGGKQVRLIKMTKERLKDDEEENAFAGQTKFDKERDILFIKCKDDWAGFTELQVQCKDIIKARDFANSYVIQSTKNTKNGGGVFQHLGYARS